MHSNFFIVGTHTIPLFIEAGVLPLKLLYYELLAKHMFEIRHRNAPGAIQDLFQDISDIHFIILDHLFQMTFTHKVLDSQFK